MLQQKEQSIFNLIEIQSTKKFYKIENEYIKSKIDFTKFPDKIDIIIEQKLYYMLEIIKELRCKFDTKILDLDESEIKNNDFTFLENINHISTHKVQFNQNQFHCINKFDKIS